MPKVAALCLILRDGLHGRARVVELENHTALSLAPGEPARSSAVSVGVRVESADEADPVFHDDGNHGGVVGREAGGVVIVPGAEDGGAIEEVLDAVADIHGPLVMEVEAVGEDVCRVGGGSVGGGEGVEEVVGRTDEGGFAKGTRSRGEPGGASGEGVLEGVVLEHGVGAVDGEVGIVVLHEVDELEGVGGVFGEDGSL